MNRNRIVWGLLSLLLLAIATFCFTQIRDEYAGRQQDKENFEKLAELFSVKPPMQEETEKEPNTELAAPRHDIARLSDQNSDCIGWLSIDDTCVDYPIMHSPEEPQKYIRKNFDGEYSDSGTPFLDYRCNLDSANLIIYGHNMANGSMFGTLSEYANCEYLEAHPNIWFETKDGMHLFKIIVAAYVDKMDEWYNFIDSDNVVDFINAAEGVLQNAIVTTGDPVQSEDHFITLSTCGGNTRSTRLIIIAKEVDTNGAI